ncbi:MAG: hypothetical protein INQ03_23110 [Candidatus Heimdallarchaeota archaeon]|nr:hypothetical protein [Candidatus Heimdallarchaeota archaeon]
MKTDMWQCEICGREFSRKNQQHSCETYSITNHHYKKGTQHSINIFELLMSHVQKFGEIKIEPMKSIIAIKKISQFCSIQIQQQSIKITFRLFTELSSSRFHAHSQQEDGRHYYQLKLNNPVDVDLELINWLHLAYIEN